MSEAYLIVGMYEITEKDLAEFSDETTQISALERWFNKVSTQFSGVLVNFIDAETLDVAQYEPRVQGLDGQWIIYDDQLNLFYWFDDLGKTPILLVGPKELVVKLQRHVLPKAYLADSNVQRVLTALKLAK